MEPLFIVDGLFPVYSSVQEGFSFDNIKEDIAYILDNTGWRQFKRNHVSTSLIKIEKLLGMPENKDFINLTVPKLPIALIKKVTAFFVAVYDKQKSEAVGYLYFQPDTKEWDFYPPSQTATGAHVSYDQAPERKNWVVAGTIHSHGSMSAFHSGTDHDDETFFDGVHITIGYVNARPEYSCSIMSQGGRAKFKDPSDLINGSPDAEVPTEWLTAIKLDEPNIIDDKAVGAKVEKLYKRYFIGDISEEAYLKKLEEFKEKAEGPIVAPAVVEAWTPPAMPGNYIRRHSGRWGGGW